MPRSKSENKSPKRKLTFSTFFSPSKRLTLTYIVFFVWVSLAIFAIIMDADLYALAVYFTSGLPLILGYLWAESAKPSLTEAADLVGSIGKARGNQDGYGNLGGGGYGGYDGYGGRGYHGRDQNDNRGNQYQNTQNVDNSVDIIIYSDDASSQIKVNETQLNTLKNIGYVDENGDKFTFKKESLDQIKNLINDNTPDPEI